MVSLGVVWETGSSDVVIILLFTIVTTIIPYLAVKSGNIVQRRSHDMIR